MLINGDRVVNKLIYEAYRQGRLDLNVAGLYKVDIIFILECPYSALLHNS